MKKKEEVDFLKIFAITNTGSPKLFDNTWRLFRKKAKEIGLPKFKEARKTFMSISNELGIPDSYSRALLGQNDPTISKYYKDMSRPRIVGKLAYYHIAVLREFDTINIFNYLVDHLCENLLAPKHVKLFKMRRIDIPQDKLYQAFENPALRDSIDIVSFFSPNSDGINDTWQVKEIDRYPNNQVWIFTRSGYEVFNTQNYRNNWSGTKDGTPLPEGSYYYRIDLDGNGTIDFEGWLYLTR